MDGKLLFCVSVGQGDKLLYGPEWKEAERGISLVDLFLQVCGSKVLGQQVQVLVSKDREFLEGAVVQVCCPLSHLAEKSQSYIKFIIKGEHVLPKNAFNITFASDRDGNSTNYKPQDRITSLCIKDPLVSEKWRIQSGSANMLHTLASKPSFENMTVEEICDEIRSIRKSEMSKSKFPGWMGEDIKTDTTDIAENMNNLIQETQEKEESGLSNPQEKIKVAQTSKMCLSKSSPLPTKKKSDVKRSTSFRGNKSFKRVSESTRKALNGKKHFDGRCKDKEKNTSSKSTKVISNNGKNISDRLSILAQPRKRLSDPTIISSTTAQNNFQVMQPTKISTLNKRSLDIKSSLDRKSVSMEKLNKRRDSITNATFIKCSDKDKIQDGTLSNKKVGLKSKCKKKTDPKEQYFIEIYARDKPDIRGKDGDHNFLQEESAVPNNCRNARQIPRTRKNSKHIEKSRDCSAEKKFSSTNTSSRNASTKETTNNREYKSLTLTYNSEVFEPKCESLIKSEDNDERSTCNSSVKNVSTHYSLQVSRNDKAMSVDNLENINAENNESKCFRNKSLSIDNEEVEDNLAPSNSRYQTAWKTCPEKGMKKDYDVLKAEKIEKDIANFSREILHNSGDNTSVESIIDTYLVHSPLKPPTRSPLFSQLLEKNNLKHSSSRSTDTSTEEILENLNDSKDSISDKLCHLDPSVPSKTSCVLPLQENEKKPITSGIRNINNYFSDNENDKYSKIPINNRKLSPQKNSGRTDDSEKMWANSRGIKFMKEGIDRRASPLCLTEFELENSLSCGSLKLTDSDAQINKPNKIPSPMTRDSDVKPFNRSEDGKNNLHLPLSIFNSAQATSTPTDPLKEFLSPTKVRSNSKSFSSGTSTPERNRKMWGNSIDGMDTMLIPSLQAFSLELRTLSETVTSNLTSLYSSFHRKYEGPDLSLSDNSRRAFTPTSPKLAENGGDQQGVAIVFRNLRKIEGQMKTIEQTTLSMLKVLEEKPFTEGNVFFGKNETSDKVGFSDATKSVSWSELKTKKCNANGNINFTWISDQQSTNESNTEPVH